MSQSSKRAPLTLDPSQGPTNGPVLFVGAGPGAPDLITVRGRQALREADVVVYAGSLVDRAHLAVCGEGCRAYDSAGMDLASQVRCMADAWNRGLKVVRLHSGDPSVYGAIREQMRLLREENVPFAVIPGVTAATAAAALLSCELTLPETSQSVVLTRSRGRTPLPESQAPARFASTGATLVFYLSAGHFSSLVRELVEEGGLSPSTPCAVASRVSWPDESAFRTTLGQVALEAEARGITRQALLLVGEALRPLEEDFPKSRDLATPGDEARLADSVCPPYDTTPTESGARDDAAPANPVRDPHAVSSPFSASVPASSPTSVPAPVSRLYDASFSHGYRNLLPDERFEGRVGVVAFSQRGRLQAERVMAGLGRERCVPIDGAGDMRARFHEMDGWVCVGAAGLVVRLMAPLLRGKAYDPAVVCLDEEGQYVTSLLGGHLAGANRLARRVARTTQGLAVVGTATDTRGYVAFDEAASREGARVLATRGILACNRALLENTPVDFYGSEDVLARYWREPPSEEGSRETRSPDGRSPDSGTPPEGPAQDTGRQTRGMQGSGLIRFAKASFTEVHVPGTTIGKAPEHVIGNTVGNRAEATDGETDSARPSRPRVLWDALTPVQLLRLQASSPLLRDTNTLVVSGRRLVLGAGCHAGLDPGLLVDETMAFLKRHDIQEDHILAVASVDRKRNERALRVLARTLGVPFVVYASSALERVADTLLPQEISVRSSVVEGHVGTPSVSEAAALRLALEQGSKPRLVVPREVLPFHREGTGGSITLAVADTGHLVPKTPPDETREIVEDGLNGMGEGSGCGDLNGESSGIGDGNGEGSGSGALNGRASGNAAAPACRDCGNQKDGRGEGPSQSPLQEGRR